MKCRTVETTARQGDRGAVLEALGVGDIDEVVVDELRMQGDIQQPGNPYPPLRD